jgi:nitric oxide reductase activation protein
LEFPVCIIGSTADYEEDDGNSELTLYSSFNSVDKKDKYRLTEISAKACNRDGAALNYAYETLLKRPEEIKILFMISDGTPNAYNYGGEIATDELKRISENCKKKGIVLFAAAVGDDKAQIEYIYGDNFLDISDMDAMPKIFTDKIKKFIKR